MMMMLEVLPRGQEWNLGNPGGSKGWRRRFESNLICCVLYICVSCYQKPGTLGILYFWCYQVLHQYNPSQRWWLPDLYKDIFCSSASPILVAIKWSWYMQIMIGINLSMCLDGMPDLAQISCLLLSTCEMYISDQCEWHYSGIWCSFEHISFT